ncbi:MAG: MFS transporter [Gammaproteobacteria bacterium]|nr:MFS transporter [Gammaproteobacteria bacterium]MCP5200688.1 MFS transporter [Gammaproteobacteria bacterium]
MAAFWFLYMAGLGVIFPYLSLYFRDTVGLTGGQLGLAMAMNPLMGIVASPLWGQWADRTGRRRGALFVLASGAALGYLLVPHAAGFAALLLCLALLSAFAAPAMAVASSLSFAVLGPGGAARFGRVRVWGTIGYLVMILAFPAVLAWARGDAAVVSNTHALALIFPLAAGLCLAAALVLVRVPATAAITVRARREDVGALLGRPAYRRLLVLALLAFGLLSGPIMLFPVFVTARGGAIETVSHLWIPMLLLEIPLIWFAGAGLRRMGARGLIAAGIALDGARWLATALAPGLTWIFGIQLLHGAVVVGLIIGMQLYVEGEVPERLRVTGQTLLGTMMSLGAVLSHLWAGLALERLGADAPYLIAGPVALVLGIAAWFFLGPGTDGSRQP